MAESNFRVAAKAFIINDGKLLLVKRRPNDVHRPDEWDIPGGRLEPGENPLEGLRREVREEAGIDVEIVCPLHVQHFTRDDNQKITMIIFLCKPLATAVRLSGEHTDYRWADPADAPPWLIGAVSNFLRFKHND